MKNPVKFLKRRKSKNCLNLTQLQVWKIPTNTKLITKHFERNFYGQKRNCESAAPSVLTMQLLLSYLNMHLKGKICKRIYVLTATKCLLKKTKFSLTIRDLVRIEPATN